MLIGQYVVVYWYVGGQGDQSKRFIWRHKALKFRDGLLDKARAEGQHVTTEFINLLNENDYTCVGC